MDSATEERVAAWISRLILVGITWRECTLLLMDSRTIFVAEQTIRLCVLWILMLGLGALGFAFAFFLYQTKACGLIGMVVRAPPIAAL